MACADTPSAQITPSTPPYKEAKPSMDEPSVAAKKIYRSKKLRLHKHDGTHRPHKDKQRRFKDDFKRPENRLRSPPEQP